MGVFAKKFKAELGALISFVISSGLVLTSKESWSPIAPILGLFISLLICKLLISSSIKSEKKSVNSQSEAAKSEMLDALRVISESQGKTGDRTSFSKLASKIEDNLITLFDNEMKSINDGLEKVKKLESDSEDIDKDLESTMKKLVNPQSKTNENH